MDSDLLVNWIDGAVRVMGHGGKKRIADVLGIEQSNLSKILTRRSGFDDKTLRCMSLILTSKDEEYEDLEILGQVIVHGIVFRLRKGEEENIVTWRLK